jgi:hypothetical protein
LSRDPCRQRYAVQWRIARMSGPKTSTPPQRAPDQQGANRDICFLRSAVSPCERSFSSCRGAGTAGVPARESPGRNRVRGRAHSAPAFRHAPQCGLESRPARGTPKRGEQLPCLHRADSGALRLSAGISQARLVRLTELQQQGLGPHHRRQRGSRPQSAEKKPCSVRWHSCERESSRCEIAKGPTKSGASRSRSTSTKSSSACAGDSNSDQLRRQCPHPS